MNPSFYLYIYILKDFIYLFLERGERREKERERNINVWLPLMRPLLGTWPATQASTLTGNWTSDPLVCRLALSHTSQGSNAFFICLVLLIFSIYFENFLRISISAYITNLFLHVVSISFGALSILVIDVLNSWCHNSNIPAISGSVTFSLSSNSFFLFCFLPLNTLYILLLKGEHDVLGKRTFGIWW